MSMSVFVDGLVDEAVRSTMDEWLQAYEIELEWRRYAPRTRALYRQKVRAFLDHWGERPQDIDSESMHVYLERTYGGYPSNRWNQAVAALRLFYQLVVFVPLSFRTQPPELRDVDRPLPLLHSPEDVLRVLRRSGDRRTSALVALFGGAGFRVEDALSLRSDAVDLEGGRVWCAWRGTALVLSEPFRDALRRYASLREEAFFFPGQANGGGTLGARSVQRRFADLSEELATTVTPRTLRLSWLRHRVVREGEVDVNELRRLSGVSSRSGIRALVRRMGLSLERGAPSRARARIVSSSM